MTPGLPGNRRLGFGLHPSLVILIVLLINGVMVGAHVRPAAACSCGRGPLPLAEGVDDYDIAFSGIQVRREMTDSASFHPVRLTFDVHQVFKGEVSSLTEVWTNPPMCGVNYGGRGEVAVVGSTIGDKAVVSFCFHRGSVDDLETAFGPPSRSYDSDGTFVALMVIGVAVTIRRQRATIR